MVVNGTKKDDSGLEDAFANKLLHRRDIEHRALPIVEMMRSS